jgi:uncharacterized repeat protein (TIGR03803 family)
MMKSCVSVYGLVVLLVFYGGLLRQVPAQTFKTLHSYNGSDGANPFAGLVLSSDTLYGTTVSGGALDMGTVFALNTDGTGFRAVHQFPNWQWPSYTNPEGVHPAAGLILSGNTLYGAALAGGSSANGTLFAVRTDGTGFTVLHTFTASSNDSSGVYTNRDGANPEGALILSDNTLYGTAAFGGSSGSGTLFAVKADGTGFTVLHSFTTSSTNSFGVYTNRDGANPWGALILSDNTLYGTALYGGCSDNGTLFAVHTDGTGFAVLHDFTGSSDGANPLAGLTLSGNTLYGTATFGGRYSHGTVFAVHTDGTGFATLHNFTTMTSTNYANRDGADPQSVLIISGNTLFGSARLGGSSGSGTVFAINIDGSDFRTLHDFTAPAIGLPHTNTDGYFPSGSLVLSGSVLYGTARYGGCYSGNGDPDGNGTIFSISLPMSPPELTVIASGDNLILAWPTNYAGFDYRGYVLQSTTDIASPVWTTNLPAPVVFDGQYMVTNPVSGTRQFFRLSQ